MSLPTKLPTKNLIPAQAAANVAGKSPEEAPLPSGAQRIPSDPNLPDLYIIPSHSKVRGASRHIVMAVYDWRKPAMERLSQYAASLAPPASPEEAIERGQQLSNILCNESFISISGFLFLVPSAGDYVVLRNKYGAGLEEDDILGSWALSR